MGTRIITARISPHDVSIGPPMTYHTNEREFSGIWARPSDTLLVFTDNSYTTPFTYHNGPVGGVSMPIQLVFWGNWWTDTQDGRDRLQLLTSRTKDLLNSNYFSELRQYSIATPPVFRGDPLVVKDPTPPGAVSSSEASQEVVDMVDNLIDDEVLPDPDEGRIGVVVFMPQGFMCTEALGAHYWDYDIDFAFDSDMFWAGWIQYFAPADAETTMRTVSHEIVEMLTDPEGDGWHTDVEGDQLAEIVDVALDSSGTKSSAWVNGVKVQAYWSARHNACVIPMDTNYAARIVGTVSEDSRKFINGGTFRPEPGDTAACRPSLPECCPEDRDYSWEVWAVNEIVELTVDCEAYRQPQFAWSIDGNYLPGSGSMVTWVDNDGFTERESIPGYGPVTIHFNANGAQLKLWAPDAGVNFDLQVSCSVTEGDIDGAVVSALQSQCEATVGYVGAVLEIEQAWIDQKSACLTAMLRRYTEQHISTGRTIRQEGINYDRGIQLITLPAYARVAQYEQTREAIKLIHAAHDLLEPDQARTFIDSLVGFE
jgi:hypothetical protein